MGIRVASQWTKTQVNALPANASPTLVYQLPAVDLAMDSAGVIVAFMIAIVAGTGTGSIEADMLRGNTIGGVRVCQAFLTQYVVPGSAYVMTGCYVDYPGVQQPQYCLVLTQNGASAAGTLQDGCLLSFVL